MSSSVHPVLGFATLWIKHLNILLTNCIEARKIVFNSVCTHYVTHWWKHVKGQETSHFTSVMQKNSDLVSSGRPNTYTLEHSRWTFVKAKVYFNCSLDQFLHELHYWKRTTTGSSILRLNLMQMWSDAVGLQEKWLFCILLLRHFLATNWALSNISWCY